MSCLLAHPTGNNFVRETAIALEENELLQELHLSIAACGDNIFSKLAQLPGASEIRRRTYPTALLNKLYLHPNREIIRLIAGRLGLSFLAGREHSYASLDTCYRLFDEKIASRLKNANDIKSVYAYEDASLACFRTAQRKGLRRIYDLPIAYWQTSRNLMEEEADRLPEWRITLTAIFDSREKCSRKDEELELANAVVTPSQFVADSLPIHIRQTKPVHVIPFGSPDILPPPPRPPSNQKLRVLFAGSMSQRKGLADLFAAIQLLPQDKFELHVMGTPLAPLAFYHQQCPHFIHHPPRSHDKVLELMRSCDVFVLPSLVEGRALVQQEALACGLPIIVTANAGAEDLVSDQRAGFLVPIRSPEAIAEKLSLLDNDRERLCNMQKAAPIKAAEVSWRAYRHRIAEVVKST